MLHQRFSAHCTVYDYIILIPCTDIDRDTHTHTHNTRDDLTTETMVLLKTLGTRY